jgi:hypothetical protein
MITLFVGTQQEQWTMENFYLDHQSQQTASKPNNMKLVHASCIDSVTSSTWADTIESDGLDSSGCLLTPSFLANQFKNRSFHLRSRTVRGKNVGKKSGTQSPFIRSLSLSRELDQSSRRSNSCSSSYPVELMTIDDRFYRDLNRCTPLMLEYLRRERSERSPIICYESDDVHDSNELDPIDLSNDTDISSYVSVGSFPIPDKKRLDKIQHDSVFVRQQHHLGRDAPILQRIFTRDVSSLDSQFSKFHRHLHSKDSHYAKD